MAGAPPSARYRPETSRPAGQVGEPPDRRHQLDLLEVERARDQRDRADRKLAMARCGEQGHDPAEAPADHLYLLVTAVLGHDLDRLRDHVVDPMLETQVAIVERDRAVVDEVGRIAARKEVFHDRAALAQVEAAGRCRERRDEQHRRMAKRPRPLRRAVAAHGALGTLVDDRRRRPAQVRDAPSDRYVPGVRGRVDEVVDAWKPHCYADSRVRPRPPAAAAGSRAAARRIGPGIRPAGSGRIRPAVQAACRAPRRALAGRPST